MAGAYDAPDAVEGCARSAVMSISHRFTSADLELMPEGDGKRYEVIDGELYVTHAPSYEHQDTAGSIYIELQLWSRQTGRGRAVQAPGVIFAEDDDVIPDVIWLSNEGLRVRRDTAGHFLVAPELVVEVLSPGSNNERRDRDVKLKLYSRRGVREYWLVDWQQRQIQVYRRAEQALTLIATLLDDDPLESPLLPGFSVPITQLWPPPQES
jgi:Uma2 family endonuclease